MKRRVIHASILGAIVTAMMVLIALTAKDGSSEYTRAVQSVRDTSLMNSHLDSEMMLILQDMVDNYDRLLTAEQALSNVRTELDKIDCEHSNSLSSAIEHKLMKTQDFKSIHSIVKNSFVSFLRVVNEAQALHKRDPLPYRNLVALEIACVRFYLSGVADDQAYLDKCISSCSKLIDDGDIIWQGAKKTRLAIRHSDKLIKKRNVLSQLVEELIDSPIEQIASNYIFDARVIQQKQLQSVRGYRIALAGLVAILFAYCAWQFIVAMRQSKQIRSSNALLESRVHERTQDLVKETKKAASFAAIIQDSPYEVFILNQINFRLEEVNRGACTGIGLDRDQLLKKSFHDLTPDHDLMSLHELLAPLSKGDSATQEVELKLLQSNGETYDVLVNLYHARFKGTPVFVAFVVDQTERKQLEQKLSQAQKLESIGQLAAGVAHEINTPMQFIGSNVEFLSQASPRIFNIIDQLHEMLSSEDLTPELAERMEEVDGLLKSSRYDHLKAQTPGAIADCIDGVERVVEIVRAMKDFSHPGSKEKSVANINELVRSASVVSKNRWKYVAKVDLDLSTVLPEIQCYPAELNQVLLNLIVNAADAINENGNTSDEQLGSISLRTQLKDEWIVVECEDTGGGIPDDVRRKVFDPFFTTKDVGKGTGQGLAISHDIIVNKHGGVLELDTEVGVGSTFRFMLPIQEVNALSYEDEQNEVLV